MISDGINVAANIPTYVAVFNSNSIDNEDVLYFLFAFRLLILLSWKLYEMQLKDAINNNKSMHFIIMQQKQYKTKICQQFTSRSSYLWPKKGLIMHPLL